MVATNPTIKGVWQPLSLILYGSVIHPLSSASRRDTRFSGRTRLSTTTSGSVDSNPTHRDVATLEVGDEVYPFEKYTPKGKEVEGAWYRGYIVCTTRRAQGPVGSSGDPSTSTANPAKAEEPQYVVVGIFPASHIHIRDELMDAEARLPDIIKSYSTSIQMNGVSSSAPAASNLPPPVPPLPLITGSIAPADTYKPTQHTMDTLQEEKEEDSESVENQRRTIPHGDPMETLASSQSGAPVSSIRSASPAESQLLKPMPPRPSLKASDATASGATQPIIDEIAAALREWHHLMFQYLNQRNYNLFHIVREHIEALHLGRRQLLAQTLNADEIVNLRRDCVTRLVSGNVVQGLDVIVRHPTWGALVTVDVEGTIDQRSWVSAVRMYAMQTSLAYINTGSNGNIPKISTIDYAASVPTPTLAHSAFPDYPRPKGQSRLQGSLARVPDKPITAKFYHVFLDLRAFVASPCAPGETAELFFSLFNKTGARFVTEEFCAILNHNGVLARDPTSHIRTLFTDLALSDIQDPLYLVCRIVRTGAMKLGGSVSSGAPLDLRRGSDASKASTDATGWVDVPATVNQGMVVTSPISPRGLGSGDPPVHYRRPFGCAVMEISQLNKMSADDPDVSSTKEHSMPIFVPTNEAPFSVLHQDIIARNTREYEKSSRADSLAVSIKIFRGDAKAIVRENIGSLQETPHTLRLGFPDVVFPEDVRNELYIKLWSGDFSAAHNAPTSRLSVANLRGVGGIGQTANNVQVTVEVRDQDGRILENVISQGSGEPLMTQFHSMVFLRNNQPTFGELIKIMLPPDIVPQWHLFFTFRNRVPGAKGIMSRAAVETQDRPFAFAFQPLFPDTRSFLEDGSHVLALFKADKLSQVTAELYLAATPWLLNGQRYEQVSALPDLLRFAPLLKDTATIRSSLCSTKMTQNPVLLSLLNWEQMTDSTLLSTVLTKFTFVGEVEIVKFLRDIFDSLFGILVSQMNEAHEMDNLVFNALVTVLGIVQDRRFSNFQPVLDVYIEKHFNCAAAATHIIYSMNHLLSDPASNETASALRAALKVWHYVFRFIARAREFQKAQEISMGGGATAEHLEAAFKRELRNHLHEVNKMMASSSPPSIIGTQTIALQHFTSILPELSEIFSTVELVTIATTFANAVASVRGKIVIWKLIMYLQIVKGFLFDNAQSRSLLVEAVVIWIKPHFGPFDEYTQTQSAGSDQARDAARVSWLESVRLCVTIVAVMLDKLQQSLVAPSVVTDRAGLRQEQDNVEYLLSLIPRLLHSYNEFQDPANYNAVERTKSPTAANVTVPVTFPESYPFSLVSYIPNSSHRNSASSTSLGSDGFALFNPGLGECAIVFLALILSSPKKHILNFLEPTLQIEGRENFKNLLTLFFKVAVSILDNDAFPRNWLNVNVLAHKVLIKMMEPVATVLIRDFIPSNEAEYTLDVNLWTDGVKMLLQLLSSEQLVIEDFSPQKRRAVHRLAGDIRGEGANILLDLWLALGAPDQTLNGAVQPTVTAGYQTVLNPLVGHIVNLCLSHHDLLRFNAVQILYSMILSGYHQSGHFDEIENEVVERLDELFMSGKGENDISRAYFIGQLRSMFEASDVEDNLRERVANFLDSVDLFLELLLSMRALPEGDEFEDDRVIARLRLMNFVRRIGRDEIYIKYVHQLVNMHLTSQNYVEAALTLKLHSDLHQWDLNLHAAPIEELGLPYQSHFHRKETLSLLILDYLGKGKAWESGLEICAELRQQHSEVTFNYNRLAEILRHEASLLEHIVTDQRFYPDYFRVAFFGKFPNAIRGKQFVYRGFEWEKLSAFCERMMNKHAGAQLLKFAGDPPVDVKFGSDLYIQCTSVTPEPDRARPMFNSPDVPAAVRAYYENSAIDLFSCTRPVLKIVGDGVEETWLEKTYFRTEEVFPTVLRRSEIVASEIVEISPIENALLDVEKKFKELETLSVQYAGLAKTSQSVSTNALSMSLNGVVDAPLDSSVPFYRQQFFGADYLVKFPERAELVRRLRHAIDQQAKVIEECLKLHGRLCPAEMIPFHETLESFFRRNFQEEIVRLAIDTQADIEIQRPDQSLQDRASLQDGRSHTRSMSSTSTTRPVQAIPAIQTGSSPVDVLSRSPLSVSNNLLKYETTNHTMTPLQRNLAHLTQHGITGVASGPNDNNSSESTSANSPRESYVNVTNGQASVTGPSGASVTGSSINSLKVRFSRFGSLNFGRKQATG